MKIALAGNPNCGKTTLFNALTGSNQFVGNWPGVTVEKKEGKLKGHEDIQIIDLPGIYSLAPYSPEEIVARNVLLKDSPDVVLNIVDGTNLERNLYLTSQLLEIGLPMVVAVNMIDVVQKQGDTLNLEQLQKRLGVPVLGISALRNEGLNELIHRMLKPIQKHDMPVYSKTLEDTLKKVQEKTQAPSIDRQRWMAVQCFAGDEESMNAQSAAVRKEVEELVAALEKEMDEDAESLLSDARYTWIAQVIDSCCVRKSTKKNTVSDRIDRIVTHRVLGLPIFAAVMFMVYWIAMGPFGSMLTDWANDGVFGDGWHFFGIGTQEYETRVEEYGNTDEIINAFLEEYGNEEMSETLESEELSMDEATAVLMELEALVPEDADVTYTVVDEETLASEDVQHTTKQDLQEAINTYLSLDIKGIGAPVPEDYGIWVPGIPVLLESVLTNFNIAEGLHGLIMDGIVAGVGAVLGFVPQMFVLFFLLAFLEGCGYMARIAFVLDRIFRRFGLSGKSFIPMLVGTGCGVPGIMASRTIENEKDRRMTIMTTTFIPCGAKIPFIAMITGAIFHGSAWVSTSCYFVGMAAILFSGIMLKKTRPFEGEPAPFVMELPMYHLPTFKNLLHSMWERGSSFIKKAGTIILLSTIVVWFTTYFGFVEGSFRMLSEEELSFSILANIGHCLSWIFIPLGFGTWQATVASLTGLVAKENIVGTMGILYGTEGNVYTALSNVFTPVSGYAFLVFNLLCAPCFAAIGAIKREMNSAKWTWFAILYECGFAYVIALLVYQFGSFFMHEANPVGLCVALVLLAGMLFQLFRPEKRRTV